MSEQEGRKVGTRFRRVEARDSGSVMITKEVSAQAPAKTKAKRGSGAALPAPPTGREDETLAFQRQGVVTPSLDPLALARLVGRNNTLGPCIDVYEVNIDGTGWVVEPIPVQESSEDEDSDEVKKFVRPDGTEPPFQPKLADPPPEPEPPDPRQAEAEAEAKKIRSFFKQPWLGESFVTQRRKLRRDRETTGNAYYEVIRNLADEVVLARVADPTLMRLVRLDEAISVEKEIERDGATFTATVWVRERRFVQIVGGKATYFKEFGATRDLHRQTGVWAAVGTRLAFEDRATEIIHFGGKLDAETPYYVPRWEGQLPSVIGSRKAEEFNLEYLDSGGIPPLLIIVHGGKMADDAVKDLRAHLQAGGKARVQAVVMEAYAATGPIDQAGSVKVTVERFGGEQLKDSLFEEYDARCEMRVRKAFRIPDLFTGQVEAQSFATAFVAYLVAEAQVFKPERDQFDEIINMKLMPALGAKLTRFRSMPLSVQSVENKLAAIKQVWDADAIDRSELLKAVNETVGMDMQEREESEQDMLDLVTQRLGVMTQEQAAFNPPDPNAGPQRVPAAGGVRKQDTRHLMSLVKATAEVIEEGLSGDPVARTRVVEAIAKLDAGQKRVFHALLATRAFGDISNDPAGAVELAGCALALLGVEAA